MAKTLVYVSCVESREIDVFLLNTVSCEVELRQRLATLGGPQPMQLSPDRRLLYVGAKHENAVLACAIDPKNGELTLLGSSPAPGEPTYVACDQTMRVMFSASYAGNNLGVFPLDAQAVPLPSSQLEVDLPHAHAALMDASNQWLLVPLLGEDAIRVYRLGHDGRLTPNEPAMVKVRAGSGPRHLVFSPDNRQVHCLNELDGSIDLFDFNAAAGTLTLKQSVSILQPGFSAKPWAAELRATPDGRFLYATERSTSVIAAFAVEAESGRLTLIDHYPTETQPRGMGVDPSGHWLIAAGQLSGRLTVYAIDPSTGRLSTRGSHATGLNPICVEILDLPA